MTAGEKPGAAGRGEDAGADRGAQTPARAWDRVGAWIDRVQGAGAGGSGSSGMFEVVRRGYDPAQVDARVRALTEQLETEQRRTRGAQQEIEAVRSRLAAAAEAAEADEATDGFGSRVEKVLRLAEAEAAEVRERADAEADQSREQARADAENHRHEVEQELLDRASRMDAEVSRRKEALNQREQEINERLEAAKAEAENIRSAARRDAEAERDEAEERSRGMTEEAQRSAERARHDTVREVNRLAGLRDAVRAEMAELHGALEPHVEPPDDDRTERGPEVRPTGVAAKGNGSDSGGGTVPT